MVETIEPGALELADIAQRDSIELHVGEVLEQDVVRLVVRALELLPGQGPSMHARELLDTAPDHDAEVLQPHPVDALVDGRDELDERDEGAIEDDERPRQQDLRYRPAVPEILHVGGRVPLEEAPNMNVLLPLGDAVRDVAEGIRGDVDAARRQPLALPGDEGPVVTDDVLDRIRDYPTLPAVGERR